MEYFSAFEEEFKMDPDEQCPVCGDRVSGYHYGLMTCESCKGFFKRTVQNKKIYTCIESQECKIDKAQRKRCPFCRFQKCLRVGMKLEAVRSDRMRGGRNKFGPMYKRDRAIKQQRRALKTQMIQAAMQGSMASMQMAFVKASQSAPSQPAFQNTCQGNHGFTTQPTINTMTDYSGSCNQKFSYLPGYHCQSNVHPMEKDLVSPVLYPTVHESIKPDKHHINPELMRVGHCRNSAEIKSEPEYLVPKLLLDLASTEPSHGALQTRIFQALHQSNHLMDPLGGYQSPFLYFIRGLEQLLFAFVDWARTSCYFKDLQVEDQMKLLQQNWSDLVVLDHIFRQMSEHNAPQKVVLITGYTFDLTLLYANGLVDVAEKLVALVHRFRALKFDFYDFVALKFLILLNPDVSNLVNKGAIERAQESVNAALMDYSLQSYPHVPDKFQQLLYRVPEVHTLALLCEEFLFFKQMNGEIPYNCLVSEMLVARRKIN